MNSVWWTLSDSAGPCHSWWVENGCWHKFQWLQLTLMMPWDGVVERNAILDWLAFDNMEKIVALRITGSDGYY